MDNRYSICIVRSTTCLLSILLLSFFKQLCIEQLTVAHTNQNLWKSTSYQNVSKTGFAKIDHTRTHLKSC